MNETAPAQHSPAPWSAYAGAVMDANNNIISEPFRCDLPLTVCAPELLNFVKQAHDTPPESWTAATVLRMREAAAALIAKATTL